MKPTNIYPNIAICLYGVSTNKLDSIKSKCSELFPAATYFESIDANCSLYKNLWLSAFKKQQHELAERKYFDICIAVEVSSAANKIGRAHV